MVIGMIKFAIPMTLPFVMKYVIDQILLGSMPLEDKITRLLYVIAITFVLFVVIRLPIEYYRQYFAQLITSRVLYDMRNKLYAHIQKLSLRFYQNRKVGEVISRIMNDVEQTKNIVETGMMNIWLDIFSLSIALLFMFFMDPILTLISIAVLPFYGMAVKKLYKRLKDLTKSRSQSLAEMQGYLHERVNGIAVTKSFTLEEYEEQQFDRKNNQFLHKALSLTRWNALTNSIINTLTDISPLLVIGFGGYMVLKGSITIGAFVAFFAYLDRIYSPLRRLVNSSTILTQATASFDRVMELWEEPFDIMDKPNAKDISQFQGEIRFNDVWFKYDEQSNWALKNIHLSISRGETIALVGMSGGGKSSLVSLISRFYDIQKGSIMIDGTDIRDMKIKGLRKNVGMVLQDNILFSGTIRDNILLGNPESTNEEIVLAAKAANAHDFITQLPNGYDTEIGEKGVKLSGGQKQRVAIARVFLKSPRILILDEATSALDLESEHLIQEALEELKKDRTTIIVAHRLSTITSADQIVLLKDGEIKEKGTHEQLMDLAGYYASLYNIQNLNEGKKELASY
jgi:ATP-binding cassette, subfamily B, putative efflux pump